MSFAVNLRRQRLEHFLSQGELAHRAGIHAVTVTRLESGATLPSMRTIRALAAALGIEPRDLANPEEVAEARRAGVGSSQDRDDADGAPGTWTGQGAADASTRT